MNISATSRLGKSVQLAHHRSPELILAGQGIIGTVNLVSSVEAAYEGRTEDAVKSGAVAGALALLQIPAGSQVLKRFMR